jgi:N-acetylmuramoyl-L-alanine amidase
MKSYSKFVIILFSIYILYPVCIFAKPSSKQKHTTAASVGTPFEQLKRRYFKLRNTDRNITREEDWRDLISDLLKFAGETKDDGLAAAALYDVASLEEQLYQVLDDQQALVALQERLELIDYQYPQSKVADDALLKHADILRTDINNEEKAIEKYQKLISAYPNSDLIDIAKSRVTNKKAQDVVVNPKNDQQENTSNFSRFTVVLDPGHGGEDYGAVGVGGLLEKDVTLDVALELKKILTMQENITVRLTRDRDEFVPLMDRTSLANDFEANVFVSIHANASPSKKLSGLETYVLDNAGDKSSKTLAERENASVKFEGEQGDLRYILSDLIQNIKLADSILLAQSVQKQILVSTEGSETKLKNLGVKRAPFYVLVGAHMPCILVELGFIDNANEGINFSDKKYRRVLAEGLSNGIINFLEQNKNVQ